jgi:phosphoribosylglycinamide formyltransferase-1
MKKIAVFASGSGSNFEAIVKAQKEGTLNAEVSLLVCDKEFAFAIKRAEKFGIETLVVDPKAFENKKAYETHILNKLDDLKIDFIALAGYMRLIGETLLNAYEGRMVNIHPSLLPAFKGKDAIGQAIAYGVQVMGVSIHYVDAGMDTGRIIAQDAFKLYGNESHEEIEEQVHAIEHRLYPRVLERLLNKGE